ncbi:hypothetical protein HGRIS_014549 [Hohenbuehelia grisea]
MVTVISNNIYDLSVRPILLTVTGTVLGFVVSYRTTSSFDRYNEGRRLWAQIILASRIFARTVWFNVPDKSSKTEATAHLSPEEILARTTIEKRTVLNLVEAFSVAIKHYLRGEDGIYYEDLYFLVKFLPEYALPAGIPSFPDNASPSVRPGSSARVDQPPAEGPSGGDYFTYPSIPIKIDHATDAHGSSETVLPLKTTGLYPPGRRATMRRSATARSTVIPRKDEVYLLPSSMPPGFQIFDIFPFSVLAKRITEQGIKLDGKRAAKVRAQMKNQTISHNIPLEISLYLGSYVAALQHRGMLDTPTNNVLLSSLNQLVDALTGLERILTTPIPFSYSFHLWAVTTIFCLLLPFQIWAALEWLTIPGTVIACFFYFGFLVAGEEIENPFGYDKNDLNLDHFTSNIIRNELHAITSVPAPDPTAWAFVPQNDLIFAADVDDSVERLPPAEWLDRGYWRMQEAMANI